MKIKNTFCINNKEIKIRTCQISDRTFILNLLKKNLFKYVAKYYKPDIQMFDDRFRKDYKERKILLRGTRKIGFFQLSKQENKLVITGLFLTASYQGQGIGKFFMNYFEILAKENKLNILELQVWDNNPAKNFYKKCGYEVVSRKKHKYTMKKELK